MTLNERAILRLADAVRVLPAGPDSICWMTELKQGIWSSPYAGTLAALLKTPQSAGALLERIPAGAERERAGQVLEQMIRRGLVEWASAPPYAAQLCREAGILPHSDERNRWEKGVTLCGLAGEIESKALEAALQSAGIPMRADGELRIVAVADYLDPRLEALHRDWLRKGLPWLPVKLAGAEVWIGPVFVPGRTACWRCLEPRLRERAWLSSQLAVTAGAPAPSVCASRICSGAEMAAQEVARWLLDGPESLEGVLFSFRWVGLDARRHKVARFPHCPACGTGQAESRPAPMKLASVYAGGSLPDGLRSGDPQAVLDRLESLASPITGIVSRLERRDLAPAPPIFTYGAVYNLALPPAPLRMPDVVLQRGVCSGRGSSLEEAKAACLAEAVERYSLQFRGDEIRVTASYQELADSAIHPNRVLLVSERQFAGREEWNRRHGLDDAVPEAFDESEEIEWLPGWSLSAGEARYLPMALACLYYRPRGKRWIGDADSSGCAAGSSFEEAVLHGVLELVERDAVGIWWFTQSGRPRYDLREIRDPLCRRVCRQLEAQGWEVWAEDITTDLGIPVVVAVAARPEGWIHGAASHPDVFTALRQAICELWQLSKAPARAGSPPSGGAGSMPYPEAAAEREFDLRDVVEDCCAKIGRAGHEVIAFDITRAEIAFPVVRVVAPGLRHRKPRFARGRLYDVPVRLGWRERALREEEFPIEPI